jgi:hypothetical protein
LRFFLLVYDLVNSRRKSRAFLALLGSNPFSMDCKQGLHELQNKVLHCGNITIMTAKPSIHERVAFNSRAFGAFHARSAIHFNKKIIK